MAFLFQDINSRHGISQLDQQSVQDLRAACELAKRKLSSLVEASATLYFSRYNIRYTASVTRAHFEALCGDLFGKTMDITRRVLSAAKVRSRVWKLTSFICLIRYVTRPMALFLMECDVTLV